MPSFSDWLIIYQIIKSSNEMKKTNISILFCFLLLFSCGGNKADQVETVVRPVRFGKVIKSGSANSQTFSGTAQSSKEAKLSFKVAGTINSLNVKVGDRIRTGQVIAQLDAIDYSIQYEQAFAQLKSAETQIKSAEAQLVASKSTYERVEKLYENNSVPLSEYEQAKTSYEAAQSQYEAAVAQVTASQKQVESSKNQVGYAQLKAPFSGVITAIMVEENELVNSGAPIASLSAEGQPEVIVGVPEVFISQISKGQKVGIHFSVLASQEFSGTVSEVGFSAGDASTYPVIIEIDNPGERIRPGMAATVLFHFGESQNNKQYLVAPVPSVGEGPDGNFVFKLEKEGDAHVAQKQTVQVGELLPSGFEIVSGLQEGDLVATAGLKALLDGMEVKLLDE